MSSITCAGVLEKDRGSHFFTSAQVVLDIQIVSEPKLQKKGIKQKTEVLSTTLDMYHKICTNEVDYNLIFQLQGCEQIF